HPHLVGAAVLVFDTIDGLGVQRATIVRIGDAIAVVVGIGTTIGVLEAIDVLRFEGTGINSVPNGVPVRVEIRTAVGIGVLIGTAVVLHDDHGFFLGARHFHGPSVFGLFVQRLFGPRAPSHASRRAQPILRIADAYVQAGAGPRRIAVRRSGPSHAETST